MTRFDGIRGVLASRRDVRLAYVFGSLAAGRAHRSSDADVAVLFSVEPPARVLDELADELRRAAGRAVDLVSLAKAPPLLAHEVVATGRCLVCRAEAERTDFEIWVVLRYLDTAHLRSVQHAYLRERVEARGAAPS